MNDPTIDRLVGLAAKRTQRTRESEEKVLEFPALAMNSQHLTILTQNFVTALSLVGFYARRTRWPCENSLIVRSLDDFMLSAIDTHSLIMNSVHHAATQAMKRLIMTAMKCLAVDQQMVDRDLLEKQTCMAANGARSSVEVIGSIQTPFDGAVEKAFKDEIADLLRDPPDHAIPSRESGNEHDNRRRCVLIESCERLRRMGEVVLRSYDIALVLALSGFGQSMVGCLFQQAFDGLKDFRIGKGKYLTRYSALFDYRRRVRGGPGR
jgi:hypothetical protein